MFALLDRRGMYMIVIVLSKLEETKYVIRLTLISSFFFFNMFIL